MFELNFEKVGILIWLSYISGPEMPLTIADINQAMVTSPDGMGIIIVGGGDSYSGILESRFDGLNFSSWHQIQELEHGRYGHVVIPIPKNLTTCN